MKLRINLAGEETIPEVIRTLIRTALEYSQPNQCIRRHISSSKDGFLIDRELIQTNGRTILLAIGKAAYSMTAAFIEESKVDVDNGIIISKHMMPSDGTIPPSVEVRTGDHPVPGNKSIESTQALISKISELSESDTVICLISGGGSALMTAPRPGVGLNDIQEVTRQLLACGAKIDEINCIRKHVDVIKGGGLLQMAQPAKVISIILSDVVGSPMDVIASGPTTPDPSTFDQMRLILEKYGLISKIPKAIQRILDMGVAGRIPESVKPIQANRWEHRNVIIGSNYLTACAVVAKARENGCQSLLMSSYMQGEAREAGAFLASIARAKRLSEGFIDAPMCLVFGGETTVTIRGNGIGGRNLEVALGAVEDINSLERTAIVTLATDGEDGPTDAAGAIVTGRTYIQGKRWGVSPSSYLNNNDSFRFFERSGGLIRTGSTGTNVNDLAMIYFW